MKEIEKPVSTLEKYKIEKLPLQKVTKEVSFSYKSINSQSEQN